MATIQGVYVALFGRPADPAGLDYFNGVTGNGKDLSAIGNLASTAEYQSRFTGMSNSQVVTSIYKSLFNRDPDAAGLTYFSEALAKGQLTINNVAIAIYDGAQGSDAALRDLKEAAARIFTTVLDTKAEIEAYKGSTAIDAAKAFISSVNLTNSSITKLTDDALALTKLLTGVSKLGLAPPEPGDGGAIAEVHDTVSVAAQVEVVGVAAPGFADLHG